jgi:hypothetical protein
MQLEPITWNEKRPNHLASFDKTLENSYSQDNSVFLFSVFVGDYDPSEMLFDYSGASLGLSFNFSANLNQGFVEGCKVIFTGDFAQSEVDLFEIPAWPRFFSHAENLSIVDYAHHLLNDSYKGHVELKGIDHPRNAQFNGFIYWVIRAPENQTDLLNISIEIVYYDGQAYKKVIQPFMLKIESNSNN